MGGWIQYFMGQTIAAWLGHHFYLHWQYSMDREFLKERAYPWIKDVAVFLDQIAIKGDDGKRCLIMSSSPEIYHNSREAWFANTTNFDLALIRWTYEKAAELADELKLKNEAVKWKQILSEWPEFAIDSKTGFMFAPEFPYNESHRHFSHLMSFHPLGLIDFSRGEADKKLILNTLDNLEEMSSDNWVGYSYSWQGNLYARAFDGENAARVLRIFAECFCLKNSFHVNGDQCKAGHTTFTYRPFTLEGNFAFASGIQEMLLQSHSGVVKLFPAIPESWKDVKFEKLRTYGAFLISAKKENGTVTEIEIYSEKGGAFVLDNPFENEFQTQKEYTLEDGRIILNMNAGETAVIEFE
jgi:alpha-L-fucosidase 2